MSHKVVVDNEVTAKELLEKGRLNKRVTIIPLNKASARGHAYLAHGQPALPPG